MALTEQQHQAIKALLECPTQAAASEASGVPLRTLKRWLTQEKFRQEYRSAQDEYLSRAVAILKRRAAEAADRLRLEMEAAKPDRGRIAAAAELLDYALKYAQMHDLAARVAALEEARRLDDARRQGAADAVA